MKIAFCLFKYFPYGGLQRDFLRIAKLCVARGHQVVVYTMEWQGQVPDNLNVILIPCNNFTNHYKAVYFSAKVNKILSESQDKVDLVIGFNKMPGLDIYYCADSCYTAKVAEQKSRFVQAFYKITNRYNAYKKLEEQVFLNKKTKWLFLSQNEQEIYKSKYKFYNNDYLLPPHIDKKRFLPVTEFDDKYEIKKHLAAQLNINVNSDWLLMVGSGFRTKGVDRSIQLVSFLKNRGICVNLIVIGQDNPSMFVNQAKKLGISNFVTFLPGREDIANFMSVSTILLHPAYRENTGTVILEAIIMGLPVVASGICGYSPYIKESGCGEVIREPFLQSDFDHTVYNIIKNDLNMLQSSKGLAFRDKADIYNADHKIIDIIENC